MNNNPLKISCEKCGAPIGFDIINQTYACKYCGQKAKLSHSIKKWESIDSLSNCAEAQEAEEHYCPSCGAYVLFKKGEASAVCDFCSGTLIRDDFAKNGRMPSAILPFVITKEEAKAQLIKWAKHNRKKNEGRFVLNNINKLKAYYLPYELVRGSVYTDVIRHGTERKYKCRGYLEGTAVNTSHQLNNMILNMAEPFDWSKARPFEYGYIAGHNVKLSDISADEVKQRISEEVENDFLPQVKKVMQTTGVELKITSSDMLSTPILVPMYFIKEGKQTAVVNGQTGRVAASVMREKKSFPWVIEPLLYTVISTLLLNLPFKFNLELLFLSATVFALLFFAAMSDGRNSLTNKIILRGHNSKAERLGKELHIEENKDVLKNPYDNTPVFIEKNSENEDVPVKIKFYSIGRIIGVLFRMLIMMGLPVIIAAIIRTIMIFGKNEPFMKYFEIKYGAAWFVLFGFICIIYWIMGVRRDMYEHPLIYEIKENGKKTLMGNKLSRKVGLLSMFGIGRLNNDGSYVTLRSFIREMGGIGIFLICFIFFLLLGCVMTILF